MQSNKLEQGFSLSVLEPTVNAHRMGEHHRSHVIELLRVGPPMSRAQLARTLGLSPSVITRLVKGLLTEGSVVECGPGEASVGRPSRLLALNPDFGSALGLYVRRQKVIGGLVNLAGEVVSRFEMSLEGPPDAETALRQITNAVSGLRQDNTFGICVVVSGLVDVEAGKEVFSPVLDWEDVPLREPLQKTLGLPVYMENDANAFALAESLYGAGAPYRDILCVILGEGLGAGVVINGALHRGAFGTAGELGHTSFNGEEGSPVCRCGEKGCLEEFCSERALEAEARRLGYSDIDVLADAARAGDDAAQGVFDRFGARLGHGLKNAVNILGPEAVILVDDLMRYADLFFDTTARIIHEKSFGRGGEKPVVLKGELGEDGFLVGAAGIVTSDYMKSPITGAPRITASSFQTQRSPSEPWPDAR